MTTIRVGSVVINGLEDHIMARAYTAVFEGCAVAREAHEDIVGNWSNRPNIYQEVEPDGVGAHGRVFVEDTANSWWEAANYGASTMPKSGGPISTGLTRPMPIRPYSAKTGPGGAHGGSGSYSLSGFRSSIRGPRNIEPRDFIGAVLEKRMAEIIEAVRNNF